MSDKPVADQVAGMIAHYYGDDLGPFLALCDEGTLWLGPGEGQLIRGRSALEDAVRRERRDLSFNVRDVSVSYMGTASPDVHAVAATYRLETVWPDGTRELSSQRASFTFSVTGEGPRLVHCHLSDAVAQPGGQGAGPASVRYVEPATPGARGSDERALRLKGARGEALYVPWPQVTFAESKGRHALVHTERGGLAESVESLAQVERAHPGLFVRCHQSYLVNTAHVVGVRRFKVLLDDGTRLPVPEKKYAQVKAALDRLMPA